MRTRTVVFSLLIVIAAFTIISDMDYRTNAQIPILDDIPLTDNVPVPDDYQFEVLGEDHAVIGIRPEGGDDFNLEVYTNTTFSTLIDNSTSTGDMVDFVVLDKTMWTSPPERGAKVTSGSTSYIIEIENDVEDYIITDSWNGAMEVTLGNPVLDLGPPGSWDDTCVLNPYILFNGTTYHMWYAGNDGTNRRIGSATSLDGINWTRHPANPLLNLGPPGSWDEYHVNKPKVLYDGMTYHMWYTGRSVSVSYRIGYANSSDGVTWTKYTGNPVLDLGPSDSWDDNEIVAHSVQYLGTSYHMWYQGFNGTNARIGYATSPDGITWTKNPANPVLDLGTTGSWDDMHVGTPTVLYDGTTYHMWYSGHDGSNYRLGYATSQDGISWTKYGANPVLDLGSSGSWDDVHINNPSVLYDGMIYYLWYQGNDGANKRIGYATSADGITWSKLQSNVEVLDANEVTGILAGITYTIELEVAPTVDLDLFIFDATGGRSDGVASSTNIGAGIDESISFTAPITGDYLLVITNEDGGTGIYIITSMTSNNPPIADAGNDQVIYEGNIIDFNGTGSFDTDGTIDAYEWDFDINDGLWWENRVPPDATQPTPTHIYGDDGVLITTLRVIDNDGAIDTDTCNITVLNLDPTVIIHSATIDIEVGLRIAGRKYNDVGMTLYEDDNPVGYLSIERIPGNPNDQMIWMPMTLDLTKSYTTTVTFIPEDPPYIGSNPIWVYIRFEDGSVEKIHHTFNVQQSMKRDSEHWNHVEPWEANINQALNGYDIKLIASAADPGSDDLGFAWSFQGSTTWYNNDGTVGTNPTDPYPSPEGIFPFSATNATYYAYNGPETITLTAEDDDGGFALDTIELS